MFASSCFTVVSMQPYRLVKYAGLFTTSIPALLVSYSQLKCMPLQEPPAKPKPETMADPELVITPQAPTVVQRILPPVKPKPKREKTVEMEKVNCCTCTCSNFQYLMHLC